jgi:hypothetical protein
MPSEMKTAPLCAVCKARARSGRSEDLLVACSCGRQLIKDLWRVLQQANARHAAYDAWGRELVVGILQRAEAVIRE